MPRALRVFFSVLFIVCLALPAFTQEISKTPPSWMPSKGETASHTYEYYPINEVYRDKSSGLWFWNSEGQWKSGSSLPITQSLDESDKVELPMNSDVPYKWHSEVKKLFAPVKIE